MVIMTVLHLPPFRLQLSRNLQLHNERLGPKRPNWRISDPNFLRAISQDAALHTRQEGLLQRVRKPENVRVVQPLNGTARVPNLATPQLRPKNRVVFYYRKLLSIWISYLQRDY